MAFENFADHSPRSRTEPDKRGDAFGGDNGRSPYILWYWLAGFAGSLAVWVGLWRIIVAVFR